MTPPESVLWPIDGSRWFPSIASRSSTRGCGRKSSFRMNVQSIDQTGLMMRSASMTIPFADRNV